MNISFSCFLKHMFLFLLTLRDTGDYKAYANTYNSDYNRPYHPYNQRLTREIILKQGVLQGIVVDPRINRDLGPAEQYRGIPYAAPPVDQLRFMPPGSATSWFGIKYADTFGPVCPQMLPNGRGMDYARREEVERLKEQLQNQSEDCLYLNVYAPYQEAGNTGVYPVVVFLHGESYEWNSGNPYDGNVLASYGKVVVVTLNYRLGILGFLRAGTEESSRSNFGLVDQIAALLWVKDNIAAFGGNPSSVTLMGHGVGAACASLLMISPMVLHQGQALFQRAILMGGTALADWALAGNPLEVTYQVAQSLNCQIHDDFATCLRRKRLDEIISAIALTPPYRTRFGPIVDSLVVPNDPVKSMTNYTDLFRRFELMYGTTQLEPHHSLNPVAMTHGMLDMERDEELLRFLQPRCEVSSDFCLSRTLAEYTSDKGRRDTSNNGYMALQPDKAAMNRDIVLDVLSDARTVAPIVKMGRLHSSLNSQSYFYVFTHKTYSKEYLTNKTYSGEELPYIFGVPLDGPKFHFTDQYTEEERLLSETMMTYVSNFAYTGDPNVQSKSEYYSLGPVSWKKFNIDWPEFDPADESYLQLDTPPKVHNHYRHEEINYWNKLFPFLADTDANTNFLTSTTQKPDYGYFPPFISSTRASGRDPGRQPTTSKGIIFGTVKHTDRKGPDNMMNNNAVYGTVVNNAPETGKTSTTNIIIAVCIVVLIGNSIFFAALYYKCYRIRRNKNGANKNDEETETLDDIDGKNVKLDEAFDVSDCNLMKMLSKNSKSDDTYEAINGNTAHSSKFKLKRQMSNSTIDAHTKVRDWIAHEIVHKYSPKFFRQAQSRTVKQKTKEDNEDDSIKLPEKDSTLGRSPTRPVSPTDDIISDIMRSPPANHLLKTSSQPKPRKPEKVSVGVDATTNIRNFFAKTDNPLSQSLDYPSYPPETPLRRSLTLEDFSPRKVDAKPEMAKSTTNIHRKTLQGEIIKISHRHSRSDPVQDFYSRTKKLKTFDPNADINVTSRDEEDKITPLTPEEALRTIKRRNYPKVLPDHPGREALIQKRRSMPASSHHVILPIPENPSRLQVPTHKMFTRLPPAPPPRISSTLGRVPGSQTSLPLYQSEPTLAEEPQSSPEPEVTYNNLYVGPILPKLTKKLSYEERQDSIPESVAAEIDDNCGKVEKIEPRTTIKLGLTRNIGDPKIGLPKPKFGDGNSGNVSHQIDKTEMKKDSDETDKPMPRHVSGIPVRSNSIKLKSIKSQIPIKSSNSSLNKESSSSESTSPSEASDTGTVVKKI